MSLENVPRSINQLLVKSGLIIVVVNPHTKRLSLTLSYYLYKGGLLAYDPTKERTKTVIKTKKIIAPPRPTPPGVSPVVPNGNNIDTSINLPLLLIDVRQAEDIDQAIEDVANQQSTKPTFKPLFITSNPNFSIFRKYDYAFEYIPNKKMWSLIPTRVSYDEFTSQRELSIISFYRPVRRIDIRVIDKLNQP